LLPHVQPVDFLAHCALSSTQGKERPSKPPNIGESEGRRNEF
jgi:hypothetical protein